MKKINYLLLIAVLSLIPCLKAKAYLAAFSGTEMTFTVGNYWDGSKWDWAGGGALYWYYNSNIDNHQSDMNNITKLTIVCQNTGALSDRDIYLMRKLINDHSLVNIDLTNAKFVATPDGTNGTEDLRIPEADVLSTIPYDQSLDGVSGSADYQKNLKDNRPYARYKDEWGFPHYGHSVAGQIGEYAFYGCTKLISVILPTGVTNVDGGCFYGCTGLKAIEIPSTVTKIDWQAFENCSNLTMVYIVNASISTVNSQAFEGCTSLLDDAFENLQNVSTIGYRAFKNCVNLGQTNFEHLMSTFKHGNVSSSDGDYDAIPYECFYGCTGLNTVDLSKVHVWNSAENATIPIRIKESAFSGCTNVKTVTLPPNLYEIQAHAFAGCPITSLTVTNAAAPTTVAEVVNDPFSGVTNTNLCTVHFPEDETTSSNEYGFDGTDACQSTITTGYKTYYGKPAFKRLLTKALNENNTYDAAPQMHAIVNFTRSFKTGWNTLVLPFGSPYYSGDGITTSASATALYKTALHNGSNSDFMIAGYRGLKNGSVFTFLKMEDNYELDEFEPLVVYMGANDITAANGTADGATAGTYTFTDVNLNYDRGTNTSYSASTVAVKADWKGYNSTDATKSWFSGNNCTEFNFTGTFNPLSSSTLISINDYFIKDGLFYRVTNAANVKSKAFRGWFHYLSGGAAKASFGIDVSDEDGNTVTGIMNINAQGEISQLENIYNLNGQIVRANATSTDGLSKGLYIVNGKKVIIK